VWVQGNPVAGAATRWGMVRRRVESKQTSPDSKKNRKKKSDLYSGSHNPTNDWYSKPMGAELTSKDRNASAVRATRTAECSPCKKRSALNPLGPGFRPPAPQSTAAGCPSACEGGGATRRFLSDRVVCVQAHELERLKEQRVGLPAIAGGRKALLGMNDVRPSLTHSLRLLFCTRESPWRDA
jgi:hypothetical protein